MNNLFVFAKEKTINQQIKDTVIPQKMVIESERNQNDKGNLIALERIIGNESCLDAIQSRVDAIESCVDVIEFEKDDPDQDLDLIQKSTSSKIMVSGSHSKIKLKKNKAFQPNFLPINAISSNGIYEDQSDQKISGEPAKTMVSRGHSKIKLKKNTTFQPNSLPINISSNDIYVDQSCQKISDDLSNTLVTNQKPSIIKGKCFECLACQFTTKKKSTYDDHLISKKHYININNIQPYLCQYCNLNQSNKSNYLRHIKNIHHINIDEFRYKGHYLIDHHDPEQQDSKLKKNIKDR